MGKFLVTADPSGNTFVQLNSYHVKLDAEDAPLQLKQMREQIHSISASEINDNNIGLLYALAEHTKKAYFDQSNLSSQQLATFLAKSLHLEKITLNQCRGLRHPPVELSPPPLPHLTHIKIEASTISATQLFGLIARAPALEAIELNCVNIQDSVTVEQLLLLLKAAPNLQSLNIINCQNDPHPKKFNLEFVRPLFHYPKASCATSKPTQSIFDHTLDWLFEQLPSSTITRWLTWLVVGEPETTVAPQNASENYAKQHGLFTPPKPGSLDKEVAKKDEEQLPPANPGM